MFSGFRGRFGRRRRPSNRPAPIDESWLRKLAAALPVESLARAACDAVPDTFALIATARDASGGAWLLAVSPRSGLDAALALAVAAARGIGEPNAQCVAASPEWGGATRRLASQVSARGRALRLLELAGDGEDAGEDDAALFVPAERLGASLANAEARALFARAAEGLRGLAAKHGGALRSAGGELELVIAASAIAALRSDDGEPTLEIRYPSRSAHPLRGGQLADALDRLEGQVRKRLGERDARDGEDGLRSRLARPFAASVAPRFAVLWPFGGVAEAADGVGVADDGGLVVFAARERVGLAELSALLRAAAALEPVLPYLTQDAAPPVRVLESARLCIAGLSVLPGVEEAAVALADAPTLYRASAIEGPFHALAAAAPAAPAASVVPAFTPAPFAAAPAVVASPAAAASLPSAPPSPQNGDEIRGEGAEGARRRRRRGRRRGGRGGRGFDEARGGEEGAGFEPGSDADELDDAAEGDEPGAEADEVRGPLSGAAAAPSVGGFETMSLLDFDDETPAPAGAVEEGPRRGTRGRRRRGRGRRGGNGGGERSEEDEEPAAAAPAAAIEAPVEDEEEHDIPELADAPEASDVEVPRYEDEEEEPESELDRVRLERERRRRERAQSGDAGSAPAEEGAAEAAERGLPRGRVALVAHADRESIAAAVLLARELRQLEGLWIYPQEELMTFFRGVATDLREGTPIYLLGFAPRPARDLLQAAAVYQGRLVWFDHHEWPPEDLGAMRATLGASYTQVRPDGDSVLPLVLPHCGRRSRFSDKLIDLVTGRFTPHDFQRWGGLWWWRLGQLMQKPGERRAELDLLIAGRPSDLTREAERCDVPPPPPEVAWVASRDFRIVHFAGIAMVVVEVPPGLDLHMALRVARERFGAMIALGRREGGESFVLAAEDSASRRPVDVAGMVEHLAQKFAWVEAQPDDDHVARFHVKGAASDAARVETLIAEIGMGRSILEG
jgi:hypothetical protein